MSLRVIVDWSDSAFPTSDEARSVTRMALSDAAKALGVLEPNVEQFEARTNDEPVKRDDVLAALSDDFAETADAMEWAKAFCARVRAGLDPTDEGWLVGWFANAMAAGERAADQRRCEASVPVEEARA